LRLIQHLTYQIKDLDLFTISILPVLPPVLRPVLELPNGAIAISDLNTLYRHLLVRNRLTTKHQTDTNGTLDLSAFLIQEAVDRLFDNSKAPRPKYPPGDISPWAKNIKTPNPPLKSLTDGLKGKQGRFRQHLLGKRIDYSGRSVITSGPNLKLNQCGIPLEIAIELFQPWLLSYICGGSSNRQIKLVGSFRQAKYLLYNSPTIIWHLLEFFLNEQVVLLNRAPTLHRFGIQAFEPVLVPGRAITLHPLVCPAFNADFDGDQMAVHVPLSLETYSEARIILLAAQNFLTPSTGSPIISLSQDMVLGCYYLTSNPQIATENYKGSNNIYSKTNSFFFSIEEVTILYHRNQISLHNSIWLRWKNPFISWESKNGPIEVRIGFNGSRVEIYNECQRYYDCWGNLVDQYIKTTAGRAILNQATLPLLPLYRQH
jgi:DNA-directed RNA polymerase subunit beta'